LGRTQKSQAASDKKLKAYACELEQKLEARTRELSEAREQQAATAEVLQVISSSPGELERVFETILANATRLCEAKFGTLFLCEGDAFRVASMHNAPPAYAKARTRMPIVRSRRDTALWRAANVKRAAQVPDITKEQAYLEGDPFVVDAATLGGYRAILSVPMLKEDTLVGVVNIFRQEVRPFSDKQVELVSNFAKQAVIAIENARLLNELRQRTDDLGEALEQKTATSEVLGVISSSPGELERVFETILANATRLCQAKFGMLYLWEEEGQYRVAALHGAPPRLAEERRRGTIIRPAPGSGLGRVARMKRTGHIADDRAIDVPPGFTPPEIAIYGGARTTLAVPMLKEDELIGVIAIYRQEVRPFTEKQIELVTNFAQQAVIAIENTRLLNELRESLQQQTATSEVLGVISSSPGELQPVFDAMLANATRLCEAKFGTLYLRDGDGFHAASLHNAPPAFAENRKRGLIRPGPGTALGRLLRTQSRWSASPMSRWNRPTSRATR